MIDKIIDEVRAKEWKIEKKDLEGFFDEFVIRKSMLSKITLRVFKDKLRNTPSESMIGSLSTKRNTINIIHVNVNPIFLCHKFILISSKKINFSKPNLLFLNKDWQFYSGKKINYKFLELAKGIYPNLREYNLKSCNFHLQMKYIPTSSLNDKLNPYLPHLYTLFKNHLEYEKQLRFTEKTTRDYSLIQQDNEFLCFLNKNHLSDFIKEKFIHNKSVQKLTIICMGFNPSHINIEWLKRVNFIFIHPYYNSKSIAFSSNLSQYLSIFLNSIFPKPLAHLKETAYFRYISQFMKNEENVKISTENHLKIILSKIKYKSFLLRHIIKKSSLLSINTKSGLIDKKILISEKIFDRNITDYNTLKSTLASLPKEYLFLELPSLFASKTVTYVINSRDLECSTCQGSGGKSSSRTKLRNTYKYDRQAHGDEIEHRGTHDHGKVYRDGKIYEVGTESYEEDFWIKCRSCNGKGIVKTYLTEDFVFEYDERTSIYIEIDPYIKEELLYKDIGVLVDSTFIMDKNDSKKYPGLFYKTNIQYLQKITLKTSITVISMNYKNKFDYKLYVINENKNENILFKAPELYSLWKFVQRIYSAK